jgi:hypothetical protein
MSPNREPFLPPRKASEYLAGLGLAASEKSLAKWRCVGGGPAFRKAGRHVLYEREALERWVEARVGPSMTSTSS